MRVIGITQLTKLISPQVCKFLGAILFLSPIVGMSQVNIFYPGDKIKSSEMNDNFEYLIEKIESLEGQIAKSKESTSIGKVDCSSDLAIRDFVSGAWFTSTINFNNEPEILTTLFFPDGTVVFRAETLSSTTEGNGLWSLDQCNLSAEVNLNSASVAVSAYLSDDGQSMPGFILENASNRWKAVTFQKRAN